MDETEDVDRTTPNDRSRKHGGTLGADDQPCRADDAEMLVTHVIDIVNKPPVEEDPVRPTAFPAGTTYH